jgi:hypothetical protein
MYTFWQPALAWNAFGIASWNLTSPGMPYPAPISMVKEALKTQNPKVFVVRRVSSCIRLRPACFTS